MYIFVYADCWFYNKKLLTLHGLYNIEIA